MRTEDIIYAEAKEPERDGVPPVMMTDQTMIRRKEKVLAKMREKGLEKLVIYEDEQHYGNFAYLVGFYTRFEEALLILDQDGTMTLMLGNENLNKAGKARFDCKSVHVSLFSLPNQPNRNEKSLEELMRDAGLRPGMRTGLAGWKLFTDRVNLCGTFYDVPCYLVETIRKILGSEALLSNETEIFIGENGVRTTNCANEIAHYEYGASLASDGMLDAMDLLDVGVKETQLGDVMVKDGQHTCVTTIAAAGERFVKGNMFPTDREVKRGVPVSLTVGYAGGSSSRAGYAVACREELPEEGRNYMEELAMPYFGAYAAWLEQIRIGMKGRELFEIVENMLPRETYHWTLCPGHLTAEEEWMSSPVYENSEELLRSGMIFQIDIIPSKPGMAGVCAESTVVLADEVLKEEIRTEYPAMWERMERRKQYLREELGLSISEDLLPMCGTVAYLRPYLLNKKCVLRMKSK